MYIYFLRKPLLLQSLIIMSLLVLSACERPKPLQSGEWGDWDAGLYSDERYNMTLWLFKENWFNEKTKQDIVLNLPNRNLSEINGDSISYSVKFTDGFMERWDIDYVQQDLGILTIYFKNDTVIRAEYKERKNTDSEFKVKKTWNK